MAWEELAAWDSYLLTGNKSGNEQEYIAWQND